MTDKPPIVVTLKLTGDGWTKPAEQKRKVEVGFRFADTWSLLWILIAFLVAAYHVGHDIAFGLCLQGGQPLNVCQDFADIPGQDVDGRVDPCEFGDGLRGKDCIEAE